MSNPSEYQKLLEYCKTKRQREVLEARIQHGTEEKTAKALGVNGRAVRSAISRVRGYAADKGAISTIGSPIHRLKAESILEDSDGNVKLRWRKTETDREKYLEALVECWKDTFDEYKGLSEIIPEPKHSEDDLLCMIPIGDAHIGMLAWGEETGEDFDMDILERDLRSAFDRLIEQAPQASTCLISDMGDLMHRNNNANRTESGNMLDCDSRWSKSFRVACKVLMYAVYRALEKFKTVHVRNVFGNHATEGEKAVNIALDLHFMNNDRVIVESSPNPFFYFQWGKSLLGFHHGDKVKHTELPMIMAADVPEKWGETKYRYFYIGHIHHKTAKEYQGCIVESFNTLSANDAWHHKSGYRAQKNIELLVYHKQYGITERFTKDISMIRDSKNAES